MRKQQLDHGALWINSIHRVFQVVRVDTGGFGTTTELLGPQAYQLRPQQRFFVGELSSCICCFVQPV